MTKYGPQSAFILVGGCNVSGDTFQLTESVEGLTEQNNGLGSSWEASVPNGLARITLEAGGGYYDDRTAGIVAAFQEKGQTKQLVAYGMQGTSVGKEVVILDGTYATIWNRIAARDGLTKAEAKHTVSATYRRGALVHGLNAETANGNTESNSLDSGASSSTLYADLHVPSLTLGGFTSVTVELLHSADNVVFSVAGTFTNVTVAGTSQRLTLSSVNRYRAIRWTFNGAGSGQSVVPFVAVAA